MTSDVMIDLDQLKKFAECKASWNAAAGVQRTRLLALIDRCQLAESMVKELQEMEQCYIRQITGLKGKLRAFEEAESPVE